MFQIISAFHDVGLTSDDPVVDGVSTLKDLIFSRFPKVAPRSVDSQTRALITSLTEGMDHSDKQIAEGTLLRVDTGYLGGDMNKIQEAFKRIVKT